MHNIYYTVYNSTMVVLVTSLVIRNVSKQWSSVCLIIFFVIKLICIYYYMLRRSIVSCG